MSTLSAFLAGNAKKTEKQTIVVSNRFCDKDGKPVPFEFKCISAKENAELRRKSTVSKPVPGKRGQYTNEVDSALYTARLAAQCTVFPDLNSTELQDSYNVYSAEELIQVMLTSGEFDRYVSAIFEANGFSGTDDLVEEAKN